MVKRGEFYAGSKLLQDLVPVVGLPLDQVGLNQCFCVYFAKECALSPINGQFVMTMTLSVYFCVQCLDSNRVIEEGKGENVS
jgi:hypothetical protein